jgi:2-polyprenyl-3-methyl-5-hydroxy-6-metoxy-1,4-benzoquinol methylase
MKKEKCPICGGIKIRIKEFSELKDPYNVIKGNFFINRCLNCRHLYLGNPLNDVQIASAYSKKYGAYVTHIMGSLRKIYLNLQGKRILSMMPKDKKLKILEVGAGEGIYSKFFYNKGYDVTATDINKPSMQKLKKLGINIKTGDFSKMNFNIKFDIVIMSHCIEHFYNPKVIVKKLKSLLNKNGIIFLKTPNSDFLFLELVKNYTYVFDIPRHINIFSKKSLRTLFEKENFNISINDEFTLNEFINFFKIKNGKRFKNYHLFFWLPLITPLAAISYFLRKSSRMIAIIK